MDSIKKRLLAAGAAALILAVCAAGYRAAGRSREWTDQLFAMDTIMTFTACGPRGQAAVEAAKEEIRRLDALLSTGLESSEVSRLNREGGGLLSPDTAALTEAALAVWQDTGGLFDFTVYPLMELWGFPSGEFRVPAAEELAAVLPLTDAGQVRFDGESLQLGSGQRIDFGGIAKGYAAARVMEIYRAHGVTSGMVSLGGNVQVLGNKPDGTPWRIGVQDPAGSSGAYLGVLSLTDRAAVTSGGYQRYFEQDGQTYIHILDPRTGCPAESDLSSVTVVSRDGTLADALSTALYVMGRADAESYWRAHQEDFGLVLVDREGRIAVTEDLADSFAPEAELLFLKEK